MGATFPISTITYDIADPSEPSVDVEFTATISGVSDLGPTDTLTVRHTTCAGALVTSTYASAAGYGPMRNLTILPTQAAVAAVLCLARGGRPAVQIGAAFEISTLSVAVSPVQVALGVPFLVTVSGVGDFGAGDVVVLRKDDCTTGPDLVVNETLSGTGPSRILTVTAGHPFPYRFVVREAMLMAGLGL